MESGVKSYTLEGEASDVEAIIRLRGWMEDEVVKERGPFSKTELTVREYDVERNALRFTIDFYR